MWSLMYGGPQACRPPGIRVRVWGKIPPPPEAAPAAVAHIRAAALQGGSGGVLQRGSGIEGGVFQSGWRVGPEPWRACLGMVRCRGLCRLEGTRSYWTVKTALASSCSPPALMVMVSV